VPSDDVGLISAIGYSASDLDMHFAAATCNSLHQACRDPNVCGAYEVTNPEVQTAVASKVTPSTIIKIKRRFQILS
jgi:hypothetical protein